MTNAMRKNGTAPMMTTCWSVSMPVSPPSRSSEPATAPMRQAHRIR